MKIIKFGEDVQGYNIPVLNEREVRASAGILFLLMFISLMEVLYRGNFLMIKYLIMVFLVDFIIRVFINPRFSPSLIIGRLIVRNQTPEYVGARQKKFAWIIGVSLASVMFVLMVLGNTYSPVTGLICLICLVFLFFESVFGICLGCKFYPLFFKDKVQFCPGEVCDIKNKQPIQKTTGAQLIVVVVFALFITLAVILLNGSLDKKPSYLFGSDVTENVE